MAFSSSAYFYPGSHRNGQIKEETNFFTQAMAKSVFACQEQKEHTWIVPKGPLNMHTETIIRYMRTTRFYAQKAKEEIFGFQQLKNESLLTAIKRDAANLRFISPKMQNYKEIVSTAIDYHPQALAYASDSMKDDIILVTKAVKKEGQALKHASTRLQDNIYVVLKAVESDGLALKYASRRLQNSEIIVQKALLSN